MWRKAICLALLMPAGCAPAAESGDIYWLDGYWEEFDPGPDAVSQVVRCDAEGNVEAALSGGHISGFAMSEDVLFLATREEAVDIWQLVRVDATGQWQVLYTTASGIFSPGVYDGWVYFSQWTFPESTSGRRILCRVSAEAYFVVVLPWEDIGYVCSRKTESITAFPYTL